MLINNGLNLFFKERLANVIYRLLTHKRDDAHKVSGIHEPGVPCILKVKEHRKYEFGARYIEFSITIDFPGTYCVSGKYTTLTI